MNFMTASGIWIGWAIVFILAIILYRMSSRQERLRLQLSNALFELQAFQDNAAVGIVLLSEQRLVQRCNREFANMFGYPQEQLLGKSVRLFHVSEASYEDFGRTAYEIINRGRHWEIEWPFQRQDGSIIWCLMRGNALDANDLSKGIIWVMQDINDRKHAEDALRNVLQEQQAIFDNAIVGMEYVKDRLIVRCNREWEHILGYQEGELQGMSTRVYYTDEVSWLQHENLTYPLFLSDQNVTNEWEFRRKDGERIWCSCHSRAIDRNDLSKGAIWVYQDISEQKYAKAALQLAMLEQEAMFDNAIAGIVFVKDGLIQRCNRGMEEMLGYGQNGLNGLSPRIYFSSDQAWHEYLSQTTAMIEVGEPVVIEWEYVKKDGSLLWCSSHGKVLDPVRPEMGAIWVYQDVTLRKQTEAALKKALHQQEVIFDSIKAAIVIIKDRKIEKINRGMEDILLFPHGELSGQSTRLYFSSDSSYLEFGARFNSIIMKGETAEGEWEFMRKDGQLVWMLFNGRAIHANDPAQGIVFSALDISERKKNEAELLASKRVLEQSLAEVEKIHVEVSQLGELSSFLQACQKADEAYAAIAEYGPRLLPESSGALYLFDDNREHLGQMLAWEREGQVQQRSARSFMASECWALRRGQQYRLDKPTRVLTCRHIHYDENSIFPYICLPLIAQGKTFGLLFIEFREGNGVQSVNIRHRLAVSLAEQIGLALANIRLRDALRLQSICDPLTGLYNRRHMEESLRRELSRASRQKTMLAVAMLDVDHFKKFNDTYGHDAGDLVLQSVAKVLKKMLRESDIVCRYGGEEFVLLLPDANEEIACECAECLLNAIRSLELRHGGKDLGKITISVGLSLYPIHTLEAENLVKLADAALYDAKRSGRDRYLISMKTAAIRA